MTKTELNTYRHLYTEGVSLCTLTQMLLEKNKQKEESKTAAEIYRLYWHCWESKREEQKHENT